MERTARLANAVNVTNPRIRIRHRFDRRNAMHDSQATAKEWLRRYTRDDSLASAGLLGARRMAVNFARLPQLLEKAGCHPGPASSIARLADFRSG
jgi:hypothetical protein